MYILIFLSMTFFTNFMLFAGNNDQKAVSKKLRLHFDINKTIIATDAVQGKDLETTINGILAEFTYAAWDGVCQQSYYQYITNVLAIQNPHLLRSSEDFKTKRSELLQQYPQFLQQYSDDLYFQYEQDKARMLAMLDHDELVIFPSFLKAIFWLEKYYPGNYAIYLRTFGQDLPEVVPAIEKATPLRFAGYGKFKGKYLSVGQDQKDFYDFFTDQNLQHYALQDDYAYWKSHGFCAIGGKIFPVDVTDAMTVSIFFDDNANDIDKPIICPIAPDRQLYDVDQLLNSGNIVAVNPMQAILDQDYFIYKIQALLK